MVLWVALVVTAWIGLSFPIAVVVGRMLGAGHAAPRGAALPTTSAAEPVGHRSQVERQRGAASRWSREARSLCASRRRVAVTHASPRVTLR
jgi:hypothetical protein